MNGKGKGESRVRSILDKGVTLNEATRKAGGEGTPVTGDLASHAKRAVRIGAAITRSANLGKQPHQRGGSSGAPSGSKQLASNGDGPAHRLGTSPSGGSNASSLKKPRSEVILRNSSGKIIERIPRTVSATKPQVSKGVATPYHYAGSRQREHESLANGRRTVTVEGHQLLGTLASVNLEPGQRLPGGLYLMHPDALGGRLALLAQQFEEHKVVRMRVHYVPSVPTLAPGSLAMYFRNDVATPVTDIGLDELRHAATHPSFVQTQVWEAATIDIKPEDANNRYFDEERGDFRFIVQGLVQVLSASALEVSDSYDSFGNLYLEYVVEFFGEELDYEIEEPQDLTIALNANAYSRTEGDLVTATLSTANAAPGFFHATTSTLPDSPDVLMYGTVNTVGGTVYTVNTSATNTPFTLEVGMGVYARLIGDPGGDPASAGTWSLILFEDLESASGTLFNLDEAGSEGQLRWATSGSLSGNVIITFHQMPLSNS